jgi:hypothetical protein
MKELALLKITISIALVVGPFGVVLYASLSGKSKVAVTVSGGPVTKGYANCLNWTSPSKLLGCNPKTENGITGEYTSVNPLAGTPFVLSIAKDKKGHVESSAGVATTFSDPTGTVGLRLAATKLIYSKGPIKGTGLSDAKAWEKFRRLNATYDPLSLKASKTKPVALPGGLSNRLGLEARLRYASTN